MTAEEIQLKAVSLLQKFFGYDTFRKGQLEVITAVASGKDATVLMPTGGGKSLCYQIPGIMLEGCAVVISPLIALMQDQVSALQANGIPAAAIHSNMTETEVRNIIEHLYSGHIKLLYMSPERLLVDIDRLSKNISISLFAVDEAHCISQWGHDFRPVYTSLSVIKEKYPSTPIIALTATADKLTRDDIIKQLNLREPFNYIGSFNRPNIAIRVIPAPTKTHRIAHISSMIKKYPTDSGIVFCLSRKITETVDAELRLKGYHSVCYHAGMNADERDKAQKEFINGDAQVVCATVAFGMGIDKSNIRWIVHYNMPGNIESYYQEIGRAGRDGLPAEATMFYSYADIITLRKFAEESGQKSVALDKLERMREFAESTVCRRRILLSYFNEDVREDCGNCDICLNPPSRIDGTVIAQKAISAILRTGSNIGVYTAVDILRGSMRNDITGNKYHLIKTFGAGRDISAIEWKHYLLQMLQLGLIDIDYERGKKLSVTPFGIDVVHGKRKILLSKFNRQETPQKQKKSAPEKHSSEKELFEILKAVRRQESVKIGIPPYLIFSDASLKDMATKAPTRKEEFALVSGVGEKKLQRFWQPFVNAVVKFLSEKRS